MSDLSIFNNGSKVVISPDKMRAWVNLQKPAGGARYTAEAITEWLPQHGVVYGADAGMIREAVASGRYDDLLEVARGRAPVAPVGGDYTLKIEKKPFTGLRVNGDGSLIYEDLSFLQEVQAGQVLAEVVPAIPAQNGMTVTGEELAPRGGSEGRQLEGSGFVVSEDGRQYLAPTLAHVSIVNEQLIVTPLKKVETVKEADGAFSFDGNLLIEGDITDNANISATGSIFVAGRAVGGQYSAGNNLLFCQGLRVQSGFGEVQAKGHVWGLCFESANIKAGGELCANHLIGCDATADGRASILGGRGAVINSNLTAKAGVVAGQLGSPNGEKTTVAAGMDQATLDHAAAIAKKAEKLSIDIQALRQNIASFERVNRMKPDKGKNDPTYKEMTSRLAQSATVLEIVEKERTRQKRSMDQATTTSIVVRGTAYPGVTIVIDTRSLNILSPMNRTRFRRSQDIIEATSSAG